MKMLLFLIGFFATMAGAFFGAAGRVDLPLSWACMGVYAVCLITAQAVMDPDLRRERIKPGPGGVDRRIRWMMLPLMIAFWVVAGLDIRWNGPGRVPAIVQLVALIGMAGSLGLMIWALKRNRFFSPVVRIQTERGHHLITDGPYRFIRHPGYLGGGCSALAAPLALGSWWALLPAAGLAAVLLRRTIIEDRFLRRELPGYTAYASQVRARLLPGIW